MTEERRIHAERSIENVVHPRVTAVLAWLLALSSSVASAQHAGAPHDAGRRHVSGRPRDAGPHEAGPHAGAADLSPDPELEAFRRMVDSDPFTDSSDDPIGRGDARDEEMRTMRLPDPEEIIEDRIPPAAGDVLTAIPGVRESEHATLIELREGLVIGREEMVLVSSARVPAEARYRIAVPRGGVLVSLEVCAEAGCRTGIPEAHEGALSAYDDAARARGAPSGLPIAHAHGVHDDRGEALVVRAAPVIEGARPLIVRVGWAAPGPVRGGRLRVILPARGSDARAAPARITVRAIDLVAPAIDGVPAEHEETRPPASSIAITAALPITARARALAAIVPCAAGDCVRVRAVAGRAELQAGDVVIAIDASPSTVAGARGRIAPAVRTLLSMMPARSRVRVIAFAARAEPIVGEWTAPTQIEAARIEAAVDRELGSATRFEAIWSAVAREGIRSGTRIVIVGDGGLTTSEQGRVALERARAAGVIVASINVADRRATRAMSEALEVLDAGLEAEEAAAGRGSDPLIARLSALLAPTEVREVVLRIGPERIALGPLRAGEELVRERAIASRVPISIALDGAIDRAQRASSELGPALTALADRGRTALVALEAADIARVGAGSCSARGPYATASAVVPREIGLALAHSRRCEEPAEVRIGPASTERASGLPPRAILRALRGRVIPPARACFRADRRGRSDYQERAEIRIELADREIASSEVRGEITPALRECLLQALEALEVPGFEGTVLVRWPLYTAPTMPPPVLSLEPEVADTIDRAIPSE